MILTRAVHVAAALLFAALANSQVTERAIPGDPVPTESGRVAGALLPSGVRAYLGVPFAAPPVRELRWREPQPVQAWNGLFHANRTAPECIQTLRASNQNHYFGEEATSEDCLYLNIWSPGRLAAGARAPVIVWIFGGGFSIGSASMANYRGESLAKKGVLYVSIAYRVGALGFLAHPELTAESPLRASGNYGFLDQVAALRWIQHNIRQFGGDPGNVTIMGQSAGSMAVSILQSSPLARGLFHRAVGMSGSVLGGTGLLDARALAVAEQQGIRLQERLGVASIAAMRYLPADRILQAQPEAGGYGPVVDGRLLVEDPNASFAAGRQNDVPIMIGYTRDEGFNAFNNARTLADYYTQAARYGDQMTELLRLYPAGNDTQARRAALDVGRDGTLGLQMRGWARAQFATGKSPAYLYLFSRVQPYASGIEFADHDPATVGAYHTGDVPYWLQTLDSLNLFRTTRSWTEYDRGLAERMSDSIVAFAKSGNPSVADNSPWPRYSLNDERVMEFGDQVRVVSLPNADKLDFLATLRPAALAVPAPARPRNRD